MPLSFDAKFAVDVESQLFLNSLLCHTKYKVYYSGCPLILQSSVVVVVVLVVVGVVVGTTPPS